METLSCWVTFGKSPSNVVEFGITDILDQEVEVPVGLPISSIIVAKFEK